MVLCRWNIWLLKGPLLNMGEPTGEKVNCWCIGPAELMIGSLSRSKVLMLNGT